MKAARVGGRRGASRYHVCPAEILAAGEAMSSAGIDMVLRRAIERGELAKDTDTELLFNFLAGAEVDHLRREHRIDTRSFASSFDTPTA